jgi:spore photoproduct lyase
MVRFPHGLLERVRERDPRSALLRGEYIRGRDGKVRLYRPQRVRVYREILSFIRSAAPGVPVELSMEDRSAWEDAGVPLPAP